jgi:hypothetical protein
MPACFTPRTFPLDGGDRHALLCYPTATLTRHEVSDREGMIGILGEERRVVEHHQDHLLQRDLVHGDAFSANSETL